MSPPVGMLSEEGFSVFFDDGLRENIGKVGKLNPVQFISR